MTKVPSAQSSTSVPVAIPSIIMPRMMPKSLPTLVMTRVLGVSDSVNILKISYAVKRTESAPVMTLIASHLRKMSANECASGDVEG